MSGAGTTSGVDSPTSDSATTASDPMADTGPRLDLGGGECEGEDCDEKCFPRMAEPCDSETGDPFAAIEATCDSETFVQSSIMGAAESVTVVDRFGYSSLWTPRRGSSFAVIGSGNAVDFGLKPLQDPDVSNPCENADGASPPVELPHPLRPIDVSGNCIEQPELVGNGDCSNTLADQVGQGIGIYDYTELRLQAKVPETHAAVSFEFAFVSEEYPQFVGSEFNDMFVAWLESERWTGNVSFDSENNPISVNAAFLDQIDYTPFEGTCFDPCYEGNNDPQCRTIARAAGTKWLNSTAPVQPGETITLVFAIFDVSDDEWSSFALIDNVHWTCDGSESPWTIPVED